MSVTDPVDGARVGSLPGDLRLPAIRRIWAGVAERADREGWPRFFSALADHETAEQARSVSSVTSPRRA